MRWAARATAVALTALIGCTSREPERVAPLVPDPGGCHRYPQPVVEVEPVRPADGGAPSSSIDLLITRWAVDRDQIPPGERGMFGFNLDDRFSPPSRRWQEPLDCAHGDFFSVIDPDQNRGPCTDGANAGGSECCPGVDNQLPNLFGGLQNRSPSFQGTTMLARDVSTGRMLFSLRVREINGPLGPALDDPYVEADLVQVWPAFVRCDSIGAGDQPYVLATRAAVPLRGSVVRGRLRLRSMGGSSTFPGMPFPLYEDEARRYETSLHAVQLRVGLSPDGISRDGNFGAHARLTEVVGALRSIPELIPNPDGLPVLIAWFVDLATPLGAANASCDYPEGAVGVGLGFETTRIRILPDAPRDRPAPGNCGATP